MNLRQLIDYAALQLLEIAETPRLEAEMLLSWLLKVDRAYLYTYPERLVDEVTRVAFDALCARRLTGEPMAYILGKKSFWTFELRVTPDTLIPRPETECLVEWVLNLLPAGPIWVADLGTGSGAIALALALERPAWHIVATDCAQKTLAVAKYNAKQLMCADRIYFSQGAWCDALPKQSYAAIVSNPPYIDFDDLEVAADVLKFEPHAALFSADSGLRDIAQIIMQAREHLCEAGLLCMEHGWKQSGAVIDLFKHYGYTHISTYPDLSGKPRVTIGRYTRI